MAKKELKEAAKHLFLQGKTQKEIAKLITISEVTISRWAKMDSWDTLKTNLLLSKKERLAEMYEELKEFNRMIKEKEGYKVPNSKEADARRKIITDIKEFETKYNISQTTTIAMDFVTFVNNIDSTIAVTISDYFNEFIADQVNKQKWQEQ